MPNLDDRRAGLLFGSFTADALSLGVHWIYDTKELSEKFGYVTDFHAPGSESYHPHKKAGEQSHVGDQALTLAKYLDESNTWNKKFFMREWVSMWDGYNDYLDHATKTVLSNIEQGKELTEAASDSSELAGPARIAPIIAFIADFSEPEVVQACIGQTGLTHDSPEAKETSAFLATACYRIIHGADAEATIRANAPAWALEKAEAVMDLEAIEAVDKLGQSCPISASLPAVLYLALKFGDDLPKAFSENAMAGGDNCARALVLGMLLGAAHGVEAIPEKWRNGLVAKAKLDSMLS